MSVSLSPLARMQFNQLGIPAAGALLFTYAAGTNNKLATFTDSSGNTQNTNPIVMDANGQCDLWLTDNLAYKLVLCPPTDTDPPTNPYWSRDNVINVEVSILALSTGANLVGFIQSGLGAAYRTLQAKGRDVKNMTDWGVVGDGVTNDTVKWQAAIDAVSLAGGGILYANRATYSLGIWYMRDNVTLILCPGTTLQCIASLLTVNQRFVNIDAVSNIVIHGNHAVVRMNKEYATGEQRHCVFMVDAHNVTITDLHANDSGGDGFYIGRNAAGTHCTNVALNNCYANNNRRNNLSIVSGSVINVIGGLYSAATGTSPQYGIDIEPNDSSDVLDSINLIGVTTSGNAAGGFLIALSNMVLTADRNASISVIGCKSIGDNASVVSGGCALRVTGTGAAWVNTLHGQVTVTDFDAIEPRGSGIFVQDWDYVKAPHVSINHARVVKPNFLNTTTQDFDKCGVVAFNFGGLLSVGNFSLNDITVSGTNTFVAFYVYDPGGLIRNYSANNVIGTTVGTSGYRNYRSESGPNPDSSITYSQEQIVSLSSSTGVRQYPGQVIETTADGAWTLDVSAADSIGQLFTFRNTGNFTAQIVPSGSDPILEWSVGTGAAGALVMNRTGDMVKLRGTTQGWAPEHISQYAQRPIATNTTAPRKSVWGSAAPTTGTWEVGDYVRNAVSTVGQPKGWYCTVAGTPGTWVSEGNL